MPQQFLHSAARTRLDRGFIMNGYLEDLAYVHHVGFTDFARKTAPGLLALLRRAGIRQGLGPGLRKWVWVRQLIRAGYDVLGADLSPAMIRLARRNAPQATFTTCSFLRLKLPPCVAVTSIGECLNYCFDRNSNSGAIGRLFARVYQALCPGGLFVFDIAEPGQIKIRVNGRLIRKEAWERKDWAIIIEVEEHDRHLTRRMTIFRKLGRLYRRTKEVHRLRLYDRSEIATRLRQAGFKVRALTACDHFCLPPAHTVFVAQKTKKGLQPARPENSQNHP